MKLKDQIALVTGASRGIGRAIAHALADEGATLVLSARTRSDLDALRAEIERTGGTAHVAAADVSSAQDVDALFGEIRERFGRLDLLVNNAGVGRFAPVRAMPLEDFDEMFRLNMRGVFLCTQRALPFMEAQRRGTIVNVASLAGRNAFVNGAGYAATKWALIGFSRSLMLEEREFNIRVVTVCPGSVETSFSPRSADKASERWILQPEDVAAAVLSAVMMPDRAMVSEIDIRPTRTQ